MLLKKPPSIEADEFKSAKWDEVTRGCDFRESDALTLEVLMEWYSVVRQCIEDSVSRTRGDDPVMPQASPGHDVLPEPLVARTRRLPAGPGLRLFLEACGLRASLSRERHSKGKGPPKRALDGHCLIDSPLDVELGPFARFERLLYELDKRFVVHREHCNVVAPELLFERLQCLFARHFANLPISSSNSLTAVGNILLNSLYDLGFVAKASHISAKNSVARFSRQSSHLK